MSLVFLSAIATRNSNGQHTAYCVNTTILVIFCLLACLSREVYAETNLSQAPKESETSIAIDTHSVEARKIIDEMEQLYRGQSSASTITMLVETPQYQRTLTMMGQSLGQELAFFRILSPKKDRGVATLKRNEEMWNYFPKINKVIKVPPSMMMGSWMGSDFTNDDLVKETQLIEAYDLSMIESETQYAVTLTPREQTVTVWGKIEYVISKEPLLPVSQAFFDDYGEKIRILTFSEPKEYGGKLMPSILEMRPLNKNGHTTRIIYEEIAFDVPEITEKTFSLRNLKSRF